MIPRLGWFDNFLDVWEDIEPISGQDCLRVIRFQNTIPRSLKCALCQCVTANEIWPYTSLGFNGGGQVRLGGVEIRLNAGMVGFLD